MPTLSHPLLGDVSCRATSHVIEQMRRMKLPTEGLTKGLTYTIEQLSKPTNSILWDDYILFSQNSLTLLTPEQIVEICVSYKTSSLLKPFLAAAGLWYHPARYYAWICDDEGATLRQIFRCLSTKFTQIDDRNVLIEMTIKNGFTLPPDFFWESQSIGLGSLTTNFGLPNSIVTWEKIDRGALLRVQLPRKRPIRYLLSKIWSFFRPGIAEDLRNAIMFGNERSMRLEFEILERKRAEAALVESDRRFHRVTDSIPGVVYRYAVSADGGESVTHISAGIRALTGYSPEEVMADSSKLWSSIHPADIEGFQQSLGVSASGRKPWSREYRMRSTDGSVRWVRSNAIPEADDGTGNIAWNGILLDITAERLATDALRESEERWKFALQGSESGVVEWDIATGEMYYSEQWRKMTGYGAGEPGTHVDALKSLIHPDDLPLATAGLEATITGQQKTLQVEHRIRKANGEWIWIEARGLITGRSPDGSARRLTGTHTDISKRREFETRLRESDTLLGKLTRQAPGVIYQFRLNPDGTSCFPYASEGIREIYGVSPTDVKISAEKVWENLHPDDFQMVADSVMESARTLEAWKCTYRVVLPERGVRWVQGYSMPERLADGATLWHGHINDVTEQKQSEQSLRESEERLSAVIRNTPNVAIQWFDADCRVELWNEASESLFGYSAQEALGQRLDDLILNAAQAGALRNSIDFIRRTGQAIGPTEFSFKRKDGREGVCLSSLFQIAGNQSRERFVCMDVDITDRKEAEAALRQSTKRLALAVGATSDAIWEWNYLTGETYYSLRWYEMLGYDSTLPMTFETWKSLCHPDDFESAISQIRATLDVAHIGGYETEFRMRHSSGRWVWIQGRGNVVERDRDGNPRLLAGTNTDITERKRIVAELRSSRDRLDFLVSATPAIIYTASPTDELPTTFISENVKTRLGFDAKEILENPRFWSDHVHPEDSKRVISEFQRLVENGSLTSEFRVRVPDGSYRWIQDQSVLIKNADGTSKEIIGHIVDVTERKLAEIAFRESEERQRLAIESARLGTWRYVTGSKAVELDERAAELIGCERLLATPLELSELIAPGDYSKLVEIAAKTYESGTDDGFETEVRIPLAEGAIRWLALRGRTIRFTSSMEKVPEYFLGTLQDITERKRSEQRLRLSEFALSRASVGAAIISPNARFLQVNNSYCEMVGRTEKDLLSMQVVDVNPEYDPVKWPSHWEDLREQKFMRFETNLKHIDGRFIPVEIEINFLEFEGVEYNFAFIRDISDRKKTRRSIKA